MKCVDLRSVVLSKITVCVSERKVVCSVEQVGEKWRLSWNDWKKTSVSLNCRAWGAFKSTHNSLSDQAKSTESYSVPPNHVGYAVPTVATSWIKRRQSLSTCWCLFFDDV